MFSALVGRCVAGGLNWSRDGGFHVQCLDFDVLSSAYFWPAVDF